MCVEGGGVHAWASLFYVQAYRGTPVLEDPSRKPAMVLAFSRMRGTFVRGLVWGLYRGPPIEGNYHILSSEGFLHLKPQTLNPVNPINPINPKP